MSVNKIRVWYGETEVKKEFESILKKNGISCENIEDVMYAVSDMLYCLQDKIKEKVKDVCDPGHCHLWHSP